MGIGADDKGGRRGGQNRDGRGRGGGITGEEAEGSWGERRNGRNEEGGGKTQGKNQPLGRGGES